MATLSEPQLFELRSQRLGCLPVINVFLQRLGRPGRVFGPLLACR